MAEFHADQAGWDELLHSKVGVVGTHMKNKADLLVLMAKRQVGKKSGDLERSIRYEITIEGGQLVATVKSDNRIALLHHEGSPPHIIVPVKAKTLRFYSRGRIVYAKLVHHPGTRPNRYFTDNLPKVIN